MDDLVQTNIFFYKVDRWMEQRFESSPKEVLANVLTLIEYYNSHICFVSNINALLKAYRCPTCDQFITKPGNLERNLTICKGRIRQFFPKIVYHLHRTLFDKFDSFGISYTDKQKLLTNLAFFDFQSISVEDKIFKDTGTKR